MMAALAGELPRAGRWPGAQFGQHILDLAREVRCAAVEIGFDRCQARLRALESLLRGVRRRNADFRQACSLFDELLHRRIMELPERVPFLLDDSFEVSKTLRGVLLQVRADIAQLAQMRFELTHCRSVPVCRGRPPSQNLGAEFGQRRETLFERAGIARGCLTEMLDLRLQTRETLLKSGFVGLQLHLVRACYTNPSHDPTTLPSPIASITDFFWRRGIFIVDNTGNVCNMEHNPEQNLRLLKTREGKQ